MREEIIPSSLCEQNQEIEIAEKAKHALQDRLKKINLRKEFLGKSTSECVKNGLKSIVFNVLQKYYDKIDIEESLHERELPEENDDVFMNLSCLIFKLINDSSKAQKSRKTFKLEIVEFPEKIMKLMQEPPRITLTARPSFELESPRIVGNRVPLDNANGLMN